MRMLTFVGASLIALVSLAAPPSTTRQASHDLPAHHGLLDGSLDSFHPAGHASADGESEIVTVTDAPGFTQALQVKSTKSEPNEYDLQSQFKLDSIALHNDDLLWASVWVRMLKTEDESGQGKIGLVLEESKEPFDKILNRRVSVGPTWQQLAVPARVRVDAPAGSLNLNLRIGGCAQTLEIGGIQLLRFDDPASVDVNSLPQTRITYAGREPDASWRKAADERIEQIRKAPLTVQVVDAAGKAVPDAKVVVEMKQHAFPFGCAYSPAAIVGEKAGLPENQEYARRFAELFNVGVDEVDMKWPAWETPAKRDLGIKAFDWMHAHGVKVRGHCLVWPSWRRLPEGLEALKSDPAALAARIDEHITDEVKAFADRATEWDVINEPYVNNDLMKVLGYPAMADWFKAAHEADPAARLLLNETSVPTNPPSDRHYDVLYDQVQELLQEGAPISAVGMQAHFGSNLTSISDLAQIFDRFAGLHIPLEITEFDIDVNDEQLQADYLRDFITFAYSQPNISGVMMWGFVENHHWHPDAALWHTNWKIKPAGEAWLDLVKKKWWTNANLTTSADGSASVRGFLGDYQITASSANLTGIATTTLTSDGSTVKLVLK